MKILYVSAHNPFPALSGGQVDIWNRLQALHTLGHQVHLVLTVKDAPSAADRSTIAGVADRLTLVRRRSLLRGLAGRLPVQMAVRAGLRTLDFGSELYDLLLLDSEFPGEILHNPTLRWAHVAVRVHNDEAAYQRKLSEAAGNFFVRHYLRMEARRMARYTPAVWRAADALWFISSDELAGFAASTSFPKARGHLLPAALDLRIAGRPPLGDARVLFVGSLAVTLNQDAIRWYLQQVHPLLLGVPGYRLVIAGSTLGRDLAAFAAEVNAYHAVELHCDVPDLKALFETSSVFISPMRRGAGVKLKTVEAVLRGLPLVSTSVGAEGSGLCAEEHCLIADEPAPFADAVRRLIRQPDAARATRDRAAAHILSHYDQARHLETLLAAL